jgi:hypothetical protein
MFALDQDFTSNIHDIIGQDVTLKCILLMQMSFNSLPKEIYQLVILNKALTAIDEGMIEASGYQRDVILDRTFNVCKTLSEDGINLKYKSAL